MKLNRLLLRILLTLTLFISIEAHGQPMYPRPPLSTTATIFPRGTSSKWGAWPF